MKFANNYLICVQSMQTFVVQFVSSKGIIINLESRQNLNTCVKC